MSNESRAKAEYIKAIVVNYFRWKRRFPMVALEAKATLQHNSMKSDRADILAISPGNILMEIEVKTSLNDLNGDIKKEVHQALLTKSKKYPVHYFCFAVLEELEVDAIKILRETYPYAGLLVVKKHSRFNYDDIKVAIRPQRFEKPPLNEKQIKEMQRIMSSNICRMANRLVGIP